jgi:hypothetical protein
MKLGDEEIARIAIWESVYPGYDRQDFTIEHHIRPILNRLQDLVHISLYEFEDGGLSNYFAFFVYVKGDGITIGTDMKNCGVVVYLSLLAPVGVTGLSEMIGGATWKSSPHLEIADVVSPDCSKDELLTLVFSAVQQSEYALLTPDEIRQTLPQNVTPYEYCMCREPWDRYFHALFANTD